MLEYKGYIGEVVYDDETEVLHARVINSGPYPISFRSRAMSKGGRSRKRLSLASAFSSDR